MLVCTYIHPTSSNIILYIYIYIMHTITHIYIYIFMGFLKWGIPKSPWVSRRVVMVIHDDWMIWGTPMTLESSTNKSSPSHHTFYGWQKPSQIGGLLHWVSHIIHLHSKKMWETMHEKQCK